MGVWTRMGQGWDKDGTRVGRPTHSLPSEWVWSRGSFEEQPAQQSADSLCQALFDGHLAKTIWTSWPALQIVLHSVSDTISDSVSLRREPKKTLKNGALVKDSFISILKWKPMVFSAFCYRPLWIQGLLFSGSHLKISENIDNATCKKIRKEVSRTFVSNILYLRKNYSLWLALLPFCPFALAPVLAL